MLPNSLKTVLLRSTILVGATAFALPAVAAVAVAAPAGTAVTEAADTGEKEITVTGSLIKNPNLVRATPVIVTTSEEIELRQSNTAEEVLREIPGVVPSIGSAINNGNGGASYVNLRGLGEQRNLVLLDGNRIVPAGLSGIVDLNNIPLALVDRVETLTGAASTTYGADAISGVVNFITKKNFTGVDISGSEQITEKGDGNYYRTDATIGGNFADDKGNAVFSVGYQHADPVYQGDRAFSYYNIYSFDGTDNGPNSGSSNAVPAQFTGTRPIDPVTGLPSTDPAVKNNGRRQLIPATGLVGPTYAPFNFNPYNLFQTPFKRFNIFGQAHYEASEHFDFYTRGMFSKNTVNTILAPGAAFAIVSTVPLSNPYLPAALRNQFCAFNTAAAGSGLYTPRFTPAECTAAAAVTSPSDPAYRTVTTEIRRRTTELGVRLSEYTTTLFDYKAGVRGKITSHLDYDLYGAYGESTNQSSVTGNVLKSRFLQSLLATNTTTCLTNTNGCVPLNVFGPAGSITAAQGAFLTAAATSSIRTQLGQVHGQISGDFGVVSPAATDPISFAVGAEYRNYKASLNPDILNQTVGEISGSGGAITPVTGGYNVTEGFGELIVPLVQDRPGIQSLTFDGGVRYSAYHVQAPSKPSYNTTTYKGEVAYEPGFGLKLRGNYAHAVRAPNINELFGPQTTGLTSLGTDPCAGTAPLGNANLRAVCLAQGAPANTIGAINLPAAGQGNQTSGGSLRLKPEIADTFGAGIVLAPKFLPGFSTSVDYYHIRVAGAISNPTVADALTSCFGSATTANVTAASATDPNCTAIRRNPTTGALDGDFATTFGVPLVSSNVGKIETQGVDVTFNYSHDLHFAKLGLSFYGNYTDYNKFQASPTSLNRDCVGYISASCGQLQPKFQWSQRTTLSFDSFDVSLLWRHIDKFRQEPDDILNGNGPAFSGASPTTKPGVVPAPGTQVNYGYIKPFDYFDLSTRISVVENLSLTLTVQNLGNRKPPLVGSGVGGQTFNSGNTFPATYDTLGRRYAVSARLKF